MIIALKKIRQCVLNSRVTYLVYVTYELDKKQKLAH